MIANLKYHIISSISNLMLFMLIMFLSSYMIEYFDFLYFIRSPEIYSIIFIFSFFVVSWGASFLIYKIKNFRNHIVVYILAYFLVAFSYAIFLLFENYSYLEYYDGKINYVIQIFNEVFVEDLAIFLVITLSVMVYSAQRIIGKKLLPKLYT